MSEAQEAEAYPGDAMCAARTLAMACEFRQAAVCLRKLQRRGEPISTAPFRLAALHAIELYFSAFLRLHGHHNSSIRKTGHSFSEKAAHAGRCGLILRRKTSEHLEAISAKREYLIARYDASLLTTATQLNRLEATLEEVAAKVAQAFFEA